MGMLGVETLSGLGKPTVEQIGQNALGATPAANPANP